MDYDLDYEPDDDDDAAEDDGDEEREDVSPPMADQVAIRTLLRSGTGRWPTPGDAPEVAPEDHEISPADEERYHTVERDGGWHTPFGAWDAVTPHNPNRCDDCHRLVGRQRQDHDATARARAMSNLPCRFHCPPEGSEEPTPAHWGWDRRLAFPACTNPAVVGSAGIGQCQYPTAKGACPARRDPLPAPERIPLVPQLVS